MVELPRWRGLLLDTDYSPRHLRYVGLVIATQLIKITTLKMLKPMMNRSSELAQSMEEKT